MVKRAQYIAIVVALVSFSLAVVVGLRGQAASAMMLTTCGLLPVVVAFRSKHKASTANE